MSFFGTSQSGEVHAQCDASQADYQMFLLNLEASNTPNISKPSPITSLNTVRIQPSSPSPTCETQVIINSEVKTAHIENNGVSNILKEKINTVSQAVANFFIAKAPFTMGGSLLLTLAYMYHTYSNIPTVQSQSYEDRYVAYVPRGITAMPRLPQVTTSYDRFKESQRLIIASSFSSAAEKLRAHELLTKITEAS
jgi:hypothetical protein